LHHNQKLASWAIFVEPLCFAAVSSPLCPPQVYSQVQDMPGLVQLVESYLEDYNSTSTSPMKLVLFLDAIEHVSRICRIIRQPLGNALLLGVGGSGRQSLARLAAFMCDYEVVQIEIAKGYGNNEWREVSWHERMHACAHALPTQLWMRSSSSGDNSSPHCRDVASTTSCGAARTSCTTHHQPLHMVGSSVRPAASAPRGNSCQCIANAMFLQRTQRIRCGSEL
jgi:hypothetical protein